MEKMLVAVFDTESQAREASRALEALSEADAIRLNAGAIVTKSAGGAITATRTHRPAPEGTLGGMAIGPLIGMLGGAAGVAVGAATGFVLGATTDAFSTKVKRDFLADVARALEPGTSAVVAQIYEEDPGRVNERMAPLGGIVVRRALTDLADEEHEKDVAAIRRRLTGGRHV